MTIGGGCDTSDGKVYNAVKLSRIEPDGLLIEYQPVSGGIGLAKLKFAMLSESLQKQFGYDPLKASAFEHQESVAAFALSLKLQRDEKIQNAVLNNMSQRPNPHVQNSIGALTQFPGHRPRSKRFCA